MFQVTLKPEKNLLVLKLTGLLTDEEAVRTADAVLEAAGKLKPGFNVINDISEARPLSQAGLGEIRRAAVGLTRLGMRRLVRVVGASAVTSMQFKRESAQAANIQGDVAATQAEAEAILERG